MTNEIMVLAELRRLYSLAVDLYYESDSWTQAENDRIERMRQRCVIQANKMLGCDLVPES